MGKIFLVWKKILYHFESVMIFIDSHKKKEETLRRLYPSAVLIDVTSHATDQWQQLSPFFPHYGIPVPFSPEVTAACAWKAYGRG